MIFLENHLTPLDPFSFPEAQERADWYNANGIPHVRIDGSEWEQGAMSCEAAYQAYRAQFDQRMMLTGGEARVEVTGSYEVLGADPQEVRARAVFRLLEPTAFFDQRATILIYEDGVFWCCGEDGTDTWDATSRAILDAPVSLTSVGDSAVVEQMIPIPTGPEPHDAWDLANIHVIAYLQDTLTKEVFQTGRLEKVGASSVGNPSWDTALRILHTEPNPFRPWTRIRYTVPLSGSPVDLGVYDLAGRRVATLLRERASGGVHEALWTGEDDAGRPLASGVYFLRLASGGTSQIMKVIRLD